MKSRKEGIKHTLFMFQNPLKSGHEMKEGDCCQGLWQWVHTFCTGARLQKYKNVNYALMQFNMFP